LSWFGVAGGEPLLNSFLGSILGLDRGYLIVFEGIDGTGKTTQCQKLVEYLEGRGFPVVRLREPTQGIWGQKIRKILTEGRGDVTPEEELQYFINDRKEDVEHNIQPALSENKIVIIDRYYYSTAAYQGALGFDPDKIVADNEVFAPRPDLLLMFRGSLDNSFDRIREGRDEFSAFEKREYLQKVQQIFDAFSGPHIKIINSDLSIEGVHASVRDVVDSLLDKAGVS